MVSEISITFDTNNFAIKYWKFFLINAFFALTWVVFATISKDIAEVIRA
jgi:hypothetical protein